MPDIDPHPSLATLPPPAPQAYTPSLIRSASPHAVIKRDKFIGFARDEESANILHEVLGGHVPNSNQVHVVDFRGAITILAAMTTPEVILIDLAGEDQPLNAIMELAEVVETGTVVLAIGAIQNLNFYRTVTRGMGVREYLPKPLSRTMVERHFLPIIMDLGGETANLRGGRLAAVAGTRGGVGTSTIAANLAWYISTEQHRHTVLLDGALNTGTLALHMDVPANNGLSTALETPERVDQLLIERSMHQAGPRLHVMAGLEKLEANIKFTGEGAASFLQTLRTRYNFAVVDAGARLEPFSRAALFNAQARVIVMDPSMISIRNLERLMSLPGGSSQHPRPYIVLNKAGAPGGLAQTYMEQSMGLRFDAVIPDLPRIVPRATTLGTQAASLRGPFRAGIAALASALGATILPDGAEPTVSKL